MTGEQPVAVKLPPRTLSKGENCSPIETYYSLNRYAGLT